LQNNKFTPGGWIIQMAQLTHWHILGAGSMGCLWAYYLGKAGRKITLIAKNPEQQEQLLDAKPLKLMKNHQEFQLRNLEISTLADLEKRHQANDQPVINNLLVCLKSHQTRNALAQIKPYLNPQATVVLMQNGMGNQELLLQLLPDCAAYAGISTEAAYSSAPLSVEHTGIGSTRIGALGKHHDHAILNKIDCELRTALNLNIESALWQKLVINCCINPLTVMYGCKNGELAENSEAQEQIMAIIAECKQVADAVGKQVYLENIEQKIADVVEKTAMNTSSMLQDILHKRATEIDYINGYISQLGQQHQIATPVNNRLIEQIKQGIYYA
jgi:2-dehydropantoate 2-reductase